MAEPVATMAAPTSNSWNFSVSSRSIAWAEHTFTHAPHFLQFSKSSTYAAGTACGNGLYMALRSYRHSSNSFNDLTGQTLSHLAQPMHFFGSTPFGASRTLALEFPGAPGEATASAP